VIERQLRAAGEQWFPVTPPIAAGARLRLGGHQQAKRRLHRRALAVVLVALVLTGGALAAALLEAIPGVRIERVARLPSVEVVAPPLGHETRLSVARHAVPFTVLMPSSLGPPDRVYLDHDRGGGAVVTLLYGNDARARLVLTEWVARSVLFYKLLDNDTPLEYVDVAGSPAVWIAGPEHEVFYRGSSPGERRLGGYLAGNVLMWHHGSVSYRLEADVSLKRALELARALRPS
jgi:hypothetical protein